MANNIFKAVIYGPAATQGSKCQFPHPATGKMVMMETGNKSRSWRQELIQEMVNDQPEKPIDEAVYVRVIIYVNRPKSHFRPNGSLTFSALKYPKSGRDTDKVARLILDGMKIAHWVKDDSRVADLHIQRRYTTEELEPERTEIFMYNLEQFGEDFYDRVIDRARDYSISKNDPARSACGTLFRDIDE